MSDDIERRLRDERGARERGYHPIQLPEAPARHGSPGSGFLRWGLVGATVVAAALAVSVLTGRLGPVTGGVGSGSAPESPVSVASATAVESAPVAAGQCGIGSLLLTAEDWGAAAGSRGTILSVGLVPGAADCSMPMPLGVRLTDGSATLVEAHSDDSGTLQLAASATHPFSVTWSNWCGDPPAAVGWEVRFGDGGWMAMADDLSSGSSVPVPPCLGDGGTHLGVARLSP